MIEYLKRNVRPSIGLIELPIDPKQVLLLFLNPFRLNKLNYKVIRYCLQKDTIILINRQQL
jgi:hypothetical protein